LPETPGVIEENVAAWFQSWSARGFITSVSHTT
jgi:hypothetical protein